jgi:hypothetical protein
MMADRGKNVVVMDKKTISRVLCGWLAIKEMEDVTV